MNQILNQYAPTQNVAPENAGSNVKYGNKADIKKIIKIFCIIVIVFGLAFIGKSVYGIVNSIPKQKDEALKVTTEQQGRHLSIMVNSSLPIQEFRYSFSTQESEIGLQGNGTNNFEYTIELPQNMSILNVTVIDYYGYKSHFNAQYFNSTTDYEEPIIKLGSVSGKLQITAEDETKLAYITYQINDEEPVRVDDVDETGKKIVKTIEIPEGSNRLQVIAYDADYNKASINQDVVGSRRPTITISTDDQYVVIVMSDDRGLSKIAVTIDDQTQEADVADMNEKSLEIKVPVAAGTHTVGVRAVNIDNLDETKTVTVTI